MPTADDLEYRTAEYVEMLRQLQSGNAGDSGPTDMTLTAGGDPRERAAFLVAPAGPLRKNPRPWRARRWNLPISYSPRWRESWSGWCSGIHTWTAGVPRSSSRLRGSTWRRRGGASGRCRAPLVTNDQPAPQSTSAASAPPRRPALKLGERPSGRPGQRAGSRAVEGPAVWHGRTRTGRTRGSRSRSGNSQCRG